MQRGLLLPRGSTGEAPAGPGLPGEWLRAPSPPWATHLPACLLDGAHGQRALDAPIRLKEHLHRSVS